MGARKTGNSISFILGPGGLGKSNEGKERKMGVTVRQKVRGKGNPWWVFIAHNGKRKSKMVGDKAAAEALASKIRERLKTGELQISPEKKMPTFGEYAKEWLYGYGETQLKYSTLKSYISVFKNHLETYKNNSNEYLKDKP
jgi:hypothetical protein